MLKIEFLSVILLDSLDAGHNLYLLLLLPKILLLNVHLLDVQCNIHNLLPGTRFFLSVSVSCSTASFNASLDL